MFAITEWLENLALIPFVDHTTWLKPKEIQWGECQGSLFCLVFLIYKRWAAVD